MKIRYTDLGARIRTARKDKKMSQEELAEKINVNTTHISHIENAKTIPSLKVIIDIMNCLDVSPNQIFCGTVETAKETLLKETESIFHGCNAEEINIIKKQIELSKELKNSK